MHAVISSHTPMAARSDEAWSSGRPFEAPSAAAPAPYRASTSAPTVSA